MDGKEYCIYLRKSRVDMDAEARGEGETLARHEKALLELAKRQRLNITQIHREIVSGDTIAARPVMQQLLQEVQPLPDGTRRDVETTPICRALENMNIPAPSGGRDWRTRTIDLILQNPAYIGKIRWNRRKTKRKVEDGIHEAIIDPATFQQAADKLARRGPAPVQFDGTLKNPFSGIAICAKCGRVLALWTNAKKYSMLKRRNRFCDNVSVSYGKFCRQRVHTPRNQSDGNGQESRIAPRGQILLIMRIKR